MGYWDIMNLWFYDLQNILNSYTKIVEQRNKAEEEEAKKQGYDKNKMSPNNMMKGVNGMMKNSMPKMPSFGGLKM
ncbi:MAG: hypothetical protein NC548_21280 [Lachnospiraceae bacterium]|nr:hypothetical protein [Lachnospiraceae bacterium]